MKYLLMSSGFVVGLTTLSVAMGSVPSRGRVTDDTVIYQNLSEIRAAKQADLNFDSDIAKLSAMEDNYREELPAVSRERLNAPAKRISSKPYRYSGVKKSRVARD